MQVVSQATRDILEQSVAVEVYARVFAEWELNSFFDTTVSGPTPVDLMFPLESVTEPRRPVRAGLPKLLINQSRIVNLEAAETKYRVPSEESAYKYFHTDALSGVGGVFGAAQVMTVQYATTAPCNKIVVGFETSFAQPVDATLETFDGTDWTAIGTFVPDVDGRIDVYLQEGGTWSTQVYRGDPQNIRGVRVSVSAMNIANVGLSVIQISPRFVLDMTDRVVDTSISRVSEEFEQTNPIGVAAAATANITFANDDGFFNAENVSSPINGLLENNVRFDVFDVVVRTDGTSEGIPAGVFFADSWSVPSGVEASVSATDRSKFLQETEAENCFYRNLPAEIIVADIIERFGHPHYDIRYAAADLNRRIPYVFFRNDQMFWDALKSLALAEQASFYFDEQDRFVWESRDHVWGNDTVDLQLRDVADGLSLPNLVSFEPRYTLSANKATVGHTPLEPVTSGGQAVNNVVWEESETLVLQASQLQQNVLTGSTEILIKSDDWTFFPDEGFVNIGGEYIGFTKSATAGRLDITERGMFNSTIKNHRINPIDNYWSFFTLRWNGTGHTKTNGNSQYGRHVVRDSFVELESPPEQDWRTLQHYMGGSLGDSYAAYGTEMVFPVSTDFEGAPYYEGLGVGGLFIHHNGTNNGYYFEIMTTQAAIDMAPRRAEVRPWRLNSGGTPWRYWLPAESGQSDLLPQGGRQFNIIPGKRHRIEVVYRADAQQFSIYVDGTVVLNFIDTEPGTKRTGGYWGVFVRDNSLVRFEHAWAFNRSNKYTDLPIIVPTFADRVLGGFNSGMLEEQWSQYNQRYRDLVFEDFGPWVHEGRQFDVDYEIAPNTASDLFVSNDQDVYKIFHKNDPFSSNFAISNRSRGPAVVVGSDPSRDNQSMSLFVYGRPIIEGGAASIERSDELSIKRRGPEEFNLESPWVQTKERAERIADWLIARWGQTNDIVEAETFLFPPLQVGDLVEVNSPGDDRLPATHKYHVVGINRSIGANTSMSLTLRRRR